jgi:hypothetical protein
MTYKRAAALVAALALAGGPAAAQEAPGTAAAGIAPAPAAAAAQPATCCTIAARTPIEIEILDAINSKDNHNGESFDFRLAMPVMVDGRVLIPAGTPGVGEVVHAARARAMGKAGELILAARYLELNGTRIPLRTLRFGNQQGRDNSSTVTTIAVASSGTVPVVGMVGYFISGGEVRVAVGARATAQISTELNLTPAE